MQAEVISVGDELTTGVVLDTNSQWLSQQLAAIGVRVSRHATVGDDLAAISTQIALSAARSDVVLISGGLGPTEDDLSRAALANVLQVPLELHADQIEPIRAFFTVRGRQMPEVNRVQAMFPAGTRPIVNTCGTAPGIRAELGRCAIYIMPGVPREMRVMFERDVLPELRERAGGQTLVSTALHCYGVGESDVGEQIKDLMTRGRNPAVGTTAKQSVISVRIYAHGDSPAQARTLLDQDVAEVRRRLGPLIFGQDEQTLAATVAALLVAQHQTLATAESCTGGLIAKRLTDISGSSAYFLQGIVSYANEAKARLLNVPAELIEQYGAVSEPVARAMAVNGRQLAGSDYAISVTGIAGPTGGTVEKPVGLVYIGIASAGGCEVSEHRMGDYLTRDEIRDRTAKAALNQLRLRLLRSV